MNNQRITANNRSYTIKLILFVAVSFLFSILHLFFQGVKSNHPMFDYIHGDVEWWMLNLGFMLNMVWLFAFAVFVGRSETRMTMKQSLMIFVYCFSLYKDIYDWFRNNNPNTKYEDWIITIALWLAIQVLYDSAKRMLWK